MRINNKNKQSTSVQQTTGQTYTGQILDNSSNAYSALAQSLEAFGDVDFDSSNFNDFEYATPAPATVTSDMLLDIPLDSDIQQVYDQSYDTYTNIHAHNTIYSDYPEDIQYYNTGEYIIPQSSTTNIANSQPTEKDILKAIAEEALIDPDQSSETSSDYSQIEVPLKKKKFENYDISGVNLHQSNNTNTSNPITNISSSDYERISKIPVATRIEPDIEDVHHKNKKNAIQARVNRQRKKNELQLLESKVAALEQNNDKLTVDNERLLRRHDAMAEELQYLRNILRNQSAISKVIQGIGNVTELKISKKFTSIPVQNDLGSIAESMGSGVCIHVDNTGNGSQVSLELCKECSKSSKSSKSTQNP